MAGRRRGFGVGALVCVLATTGALYTGSVASADSEDTDARSSARPTGPAAAPADTLLSRNKPVTASSSAGCCAARNAVDGSSSTRWASRSGHDPEWIYVDLGTSAHIARVRLQWDASCATAYRVETSANSTTWTPIYSTTTGDGAVDDLTVEGTGRYVRMFGTQRCRASASKGYSLQEYDIYGSTDSVPPTAPGTPTLVRATPTSVTIAWTAATDNVGVTGYDVYKDGQNCASVGADTLTATCTGLSPKQTYGFYVNARDVAGNVSPPSETLQVTTPPSDDDTPPTAPTNVRTTAVTSTSVSLAWTAATDNPGGGVAGYNIYDGTAKVATSTTTSATISGLAPGSRHSYTVTAFDGNNNESPASSPAVPVTTPGGSCTDPICEVEQIATDNDVVWGLVTLPDGSILYNRRDAHNITRLVPSTGVKTDVGTVPDVQSTNGEGGLTGLAISPDFRTDRWLYIMHTAEDDNRIVRFRLAENNTLDLASRQTLVTGIARNKFHNGGRLRWGPDNKLYAGTGDAQNKASAQNRNSLNGKILRINPNGSIPSDNPFNNHVWSYGHRNVQGLAFDSQGRLWAQEFGDGSQDETNLIVKGGNYGWPNCEGTVSQAGQGCGTPGYIAPKRTYPVRDCSCSGIAIVNDVLFVAAQRGTRLYRAEISGSSLVNVRSYFQGTYGRLRTVEPAPDGGLWLATSNAGDKDSTPNNSNNRIFHVTLGR